MFTESREARSCSTLRAPMIGAVTAGWALTHDTAALTGCNPRSAQNALEGLRSEIRSHGLHPVLDLAQQLVEVLG